jgi:hypothetical protein
MFDSESNETDPSRQAAVKLQIAPKTRGVLRPKSPRMNTPGPVIGA